MCHKFFILLIMVLFSSGCHSVDLVKETQFVSTAITGTPSPKAAITDRPLLLTVTPTALPIRTPFPTFTSSAPLPTAEPTLNVKQCSPLESSWPHGFTISGKMLRICDQGVCEMDFQNQIAHISPFEDIPIGKNSSQVFFSPNRQMMGFTKFTRDGNNKIIKSTLYIYDKSKNNRIFSWNSEWWLEGWVDNNRVNLAHSSGEQKFYMIFDFNHGITEQKLIPPLNNALSGDMFIVDAHANYDPLYTMVAYIGDDYNLNLRETETGELVWQRRAGGVMLQSSSWSPDGKSLAVASPIGSDELFIVTRDGQERRLTNFTKDFSGIGVSIGSMDWSPDGRFVALWLLFYSGGEYNWKFAVINAESGELTIYEYCFSVSNGLSPTSIWSPEGGQIAVEIYQEDKSNPNGGNLVYNLIVIDRFLHEAVQLPVGQFLIGWMK